MGGALGFYDNCSEDEPGEIKKIIEPQFNRAVLFDVTQNYGMDCQVLSYVRMAKLVIQWPFIIYSSSIHQLIRLG